MKLSGERGLNLIELQIATGVIVILGGALLVGHFFPATQRPLLIVLLAAVGLLFANIARERLAETFDERRISRAVAQLETADPRGAALVARIWSDGKNYAFALRECADEITPLLDRPAVRMPALRLLLRAGDLRSVNIDGPLALLAPELPEDLMLAALTNAKNLELRFRLLSGFLPRATSSEARRAMLGELFSRYHGSPQLPPASPPLEWLDVLGRYADDLRNVPRIDSLHVELHASYLGVVEDLKAQSG